MALHLDPKRRLYLADSHCLEFEAEVRRCKEIEPGRFAVYLESTYFYPTSGGQPHDVGMLGEAAVVDVQEDGEGQVVHFTGSGVPLGATQASIDGNRREDHMQQHSGQHLLSASCERLYQRDTLSFHLGRERCSIDLTGLPLTSLELRKLEATVNELIRETRTVRARIASPEELTQLRHSAPAGLNEVRVIEIEDWDLNACCGTHVATTSAIGFTKLLGQERIRKQNRLYFCCGTRALKAFGEALEQRDELLKILTCGPQDLRRRVSDLVMEVKSQRKSIRLLEAQGAAEKARLWSRSSPIYGDVPVVVREVEGDFDSLRVLATAINELDAVAILGAHSDRAYLLFSCPRGLQLDLRQAMHLAADEIDGKGGGPGPRVQGSGARLAGLESALETARAWVEGNLRDAR